MKRWAGLLWPVLAIAAAAGFLRGGDLALRPLHNDEAINAFKLAELRDRGHYRYDPHEYHGPTLYYASLPFLGAAAWSRPDQPDEASLRWVTVAFGIGLILLLPLVRDGMGIGPTWGAGVLTAVSPAMVYYSRYFIHEIPLVFFTFLTLAAGWRYYRKPGWGWAATVGIGLGLMYATKETFVFAVAAAAVGVAVTRVGARTGPGGSEGAGPNEMREQGAASIGGWRGALASVRVRHAALALGLAGIVATVFFSSFFANMSGPLDAVRTYFVWLERAGGASPHVHPWYFYFQRLGWYRWPGERLWTEGLILVLATVGGAVAWGRCSSTGADPRWGRFLAVYTVVLAALYSVIPYKTPWCFLGFFHGAILLAGIGAWAAIVAVRTLWVRVPVAACLAVATGHLGWQAWRASYVVPADFRNPYVYGHTAGDVVELLARVDDLVRAHPDGLRMQMQVMAPGSEYWPLPWYWRRMERVGWWDRVPENPFAPVVVAATSLGAALDERSDHAWKNVGMFELRPRFFVEVYVENEFWAQFLAARAAVRDAARGE